MGIHRPSKSSQASSPCCRSRNQAAAAKETLRSRAMKSSRGCAGTGSQRPRSSYGGQQCKPRVMIGGCVPSVPSRLAPCPSAPVDVTSHTTSGSRHVASQRRPTRGGSANCTDSTTRSLCGPSAMFGGALESVGVSGRARLAVGAGDHVGYAGRRPDEVLVWVEVLADPDRQLPPELDGAAHAEPGARGQRRAGRDRVREVTGYATAARRFGGEPAGSYPSGHGRGPLLGQFTDAELGGAPIAGAPPD
jgi:hypothetical protein